MCIECGCEVTSKAERTKDDQETTVVEAEAEETAVA